MRKPSVALGFLLLIAGKRRLVSHSKRGASMNRRSAVMALLAASITGHHRLAHSAERLPLVCYAGNANPTLSKYLLDPFLAGLREHGWEDGKNVQIVYRWGGGVTEKYLQIADEFIAMKCDVIVAGGLTSAYPIRSRTSTVPIVCPLWHDPVLDGYAQSFSHPGGNVTGTSTMNEVLLTKRLELLQECVPKLKSVAIVHDPSLPHVARELAAYKEAAPKLGVQVVGYEMIKQSDISPVFAEIRHHRHDAVLVAPWSLTTAYATLIADEALKHRLPCVGEPEQFARAGGFASYGADWAALYRQSTDHIDKILRGAKPGDLPIQAATRFILAINKKTADALGIAIPPDVLVRVDRLIE
jgi:putative ABC transport system substrate-binding protein